MTGPRPVQPGFWSECLLITPDTDTLVASYDAHTAGETLRWLRVVVRMLQSVLTDDEAEPVTFWLLFGQERSHADLEQGQPLELTLRPSRRPGLAVRFTARPVIFLPLLDRDVRQPPACSQQWAQPMAVATALTQYAPPTRAALDQR
ncbi:hypothetical protein ACFVJK_37395 [Streptomyces sp. NPDC127172]|uniref:hypothetical protein n=1 Tax=Streptomyces sp. NPDC127172 TaxID=3345382 RepID=UPI0036446990